MLARIQLTTTYGYKNLSFEHAPTIDLGRSIPISSTIRGACSLWNVGTEAVQIKIAKIPLFETDSQIKQIIIKLLKCRPNLRHEFVAE